MRKAVLLLLLCTSSSWATFSGYTYRREVVIDASKVGSGTEVNFPVLVSINDNSLSSTTASGGRLNSSGFDIVFSTMQDCSFLLNWDTETLMNVGVSTMNTWVKIPSVSSTTDTPFFMCYGNAGTTTYQGFSTGTWDSNYLGVWHLPNGNVLTAVDSTANKNNGMVSGSTPTVGQIDGGANFNGSSKIDMGTDIASLQPSTALTLEQWAKLTVPYASQNVYSFSIDYPYDGGSNDPYVSYGLVINDPNSPSNWILWTSGGGTNNQTFAGGTIDTNWHLIAGTCQSGSQHVYIDGADATGGGESNRTGNQAYTSGSDLQFGQNNFTGVLDEIRISNIVRSPDWIKTEYNNQSSPSTFLAVGPETQSPFATNDRGLVVQGGKLNIIGGKMLIK